MRLALGLIGLVAVAAPAHADTICEWMAYTDLVVSADAPAPAGAMQATGHEHVTTQVALAMFEATNAIDQRYETYLGLAKGDGTASPDAAAITAAYQVLLAHYPAQKAGLDDSYRIAMNAVTDAKAREAGRLIGEAAAKLALATAAIDPAIKQVPYRPRTTPGVYIATALPVIQPFSTAFKPWVVKSAEQFRPAPPPSLTSATWARDFNEVKALGGKGSTTRTEQQSLMARYRITPNMMPTMRFVADAPGRTLVQNARMFAMFGMASDDAYMTTLAAKIHYNFWRPVTAIRNAQDDANAATDVDPAWVPLINTPNHPEYPCGHCTYAASAAEIMKSETGASPPGGVRVSSSSIPNSAVQVLPTWDDWVREVSFSRTLGGVHYRFSNEAGEKIGRDVAKLTLAKVMRPLKP
jgi:hypothetical protein